MTFRHPVNNVRLTKALFLEESYEDRTFVKYTLKDVDHDGYTSLYRKYLEMQDPTELYFARAYFESFEHWELVANAPWMRDHIARWRAELDLVVRANALNNITSVAKDPEHRSYYEANKYLLAGSWKNKEERKAGRPSKEAIKIKAEELFKASLETTDDLARITKQ